MTLFDKVLDWLFHCKLYNGYTILVSETCFAVSVDQRAEILSLCIDENVGKFLEENNMIWRWKYKKLDASAAIICYIKNGNPILQIHEHARQMTFSRKHEAAMFRLSFGE